MPCVGCRVYYEVVRLYLGVFFGYLAEHLEEEAVAELEYIGLVNCCDPSEPVGPGVLEGKPYSATKR